MTPLALLPRAWAVATLALAAGVTGIVAPGPSNAAVPRVPFDPPVSDQRAVALLRAAYDAGRSLAYAGTAFVGVGGSYVKVRLRHVPGKGTYVAPDDGAPHAPMLQPDPLRGAAGDPLALLREHYQLILGGTAEVAGRPVVQVRANRIGGGLAALFSVDRRSRLVLARSAFDQSGRRYEQMVFTDVSVDGSPKPLADQAGPAGPSTATSDPLVAQRPLVGADVAGGVVESSRGGAMAGLRAGGWHVEQRLPGGFELYDARLVGPRSTPVLHLSYSDGLTSLSVFEERGRLPVSLRGWTAVTLPGVAAGRTVYADGSSPQRLTWQGGDTVFAVLSDAAPARVAAVVASLPCGEPSDGVLDRLRRGFDRLGSWVDPFR